MVTVDLMTTGVDIPDLEFIVFLRPVKSRILFEQILGRGTRKGDKYPDKSHFVVFDCFDGTLLEYFRTDQHTVEPPNKPSARLRRSSMTSGRTVTVTTTSAAWSSGSSGSTRRCPARPRAVRPLHSRWRLAAFAADLPRLVRESFALTMSILRDPDFQQLIDRLPSRLAQASSSP